MSNLWAKLLEAAPELHWTMKHSLLVARVEHHELRVSGEYGWGEYGSLRIPKDVATQIHAIARAAVESDCLARLESGETPADELARLRTEMSKVLRERDALMAATNCDTHADAVKWCWARRGES